MESKPFHVRMEEAKKEAIERHVNAVRIKLGYHSRPAQIEKPIKIEKPVETEKPVKIEEPVEIEKPVKIEKPAQIEKSSPITTDIKEEAKPAISLMNLPRTNDAQASVSEVPRNRYAGLTASRKRKFPALSASPPVHDPSDHQEVDDGESDPATTHIKEENVQPSQKGSSGSITTDSPKAIEQEMKSQQRPFAPPKKPANKKSSNRIMHLVETRTTSNPEDWYENISLNQRFSRGDLETLKYILTLIKNCQTTARTGGDVDINFERLRNRLHTMEFYDFISGVLIKKSKVLEDGGLETIFEDVQYPWDIRADALSLYRKWRNGILDPHLLRGIDTKKGKTLKAQNFFSRSIDRAYLGRISCNYAGAGNLVNGQWWPLQICAMRDGAHGEIEGGIHGKRGEGAFSIVLSGGGYSDVDEGDVIKYCGTSGAEEKASVGTECLKESFISGQEIRVLRSSSLSRNNPYRPPKGLRYDGVYEIVDYEILDRDTAMHRFTLRRCENQDLIRCCGDEKRPTDEELAEYSKVRGLIGLSN